MQLAGGTVSTVGAPTGLQSVRSARLGGGARGAGKARSQTLTSSRRGERRCAVTWRVPCSMSAQGSPQRVSKLGKLLQNINVVGVKLFLRTCFGRQDLAMPHLDVQDIRQVNWTALQAAGFHGCVFDKDNTLTLPYVLEVHPPLRASLDDCRAAFSDRLAILSNSAGLHQYDPDGTLANALERGLSIPVLRHAYKKPAGTPEELEAHFGCAAHQLIMVGDRYFTDVVYGNQSGMLTIRVMPFTEKGETVVVKAVRALEDWVVRLWRNGGVRPAHHPLVGDVDDIAFTYSSRTE